MRRCWHVEASRIPVSPPFCPLRPDARTRHPSYWHEGFQKLSPLTLPCPGFRNQEWREIHAATKLFIETRGSEAASFGCTGVELLGVHEAVGAANVSACGALMVGTTKEPVQEIRREWISFGRVRYYRAPQQSAVLVWRFGSRNVTIEQRGCLRMFMKCGLFSGLALSGAVLLSSQAEAQNAIHIRARLASCIRKGGWRLPAKWEVRFFPDHR